jgi:ABC-type uncharacterized transport system fused permease/ATPase subunit
VQSQLSKQQRKKQKEKDKKAVGTGNDIQEIASEEYKPPMKSNFDFSSIFRIDTNYLLEPFNKYISIIGVPKAVSSSWRLYNIIAPLYGHIETVQLLAAELVFVQTLNTISYHCSVALATNIQDMSNELSNMQAGEGTPEKTWNIAGYAAAAVIGLFIVETIKDYGIRHVEAKFKTKVTDELLKQHLKTDKTDLNGNPRKCLSYSYTMHSTEAATFLPTMFKDIGTGARGFNTTVISSATASLSGVSALYSIYNISNMQGRSFFSLDNILGAKIFCAGMVALVSSKISSEFSESNKERNKPQANAAKLETYLFNNSLFIAALGTEKHISGLIKRSFDAIRTVEFKTTYLESIMKSWNFLSEKANTLLDIILAIHKKSSTAGFSKLDSSSLFVNLNLVYNLLNWSTVNAKELSALDVTTSRLEAYSENKLIGQKTDLYRISDNKDNSIIIRSGLHMTSSETGKSGELNKVVKLNFTNDYIIPLKIRKSSEAGYYMVSNRVSVNGGIGTGKSTLLKAIAGLELNKVSFQGTISFPSNTDPANSTINHIRLIPQEVNFPPATSMLDMLCLLKNKINTNEYLQKKEKPKDDSSQDYANAISATQGTDSDDLSQKARQIYDILTLVKARNDLIDSLSPDAQKYLKTIQYIDPKDINKESKDAVEKEVQSFLISCISYEAQEILLELGINDRFTKYFISIDKMKEVHPSWKDALSGGMTKALCIVQVLTSHEKPQVLLLDETRGAIDTHNVRNLEIVLDKYLPETLIIEICHPEQDVDPNTHPFFTQILNLDEYKVMERSSSSILATPTRMNERRPASAPFFGSVDDRILPVSNFIHHLRNIPEGTRSRGNSDDEQSELSSPPKLKRYTSNSTDGSLSPPKNFAEKEKDRRDKGQQLLKTTTNRKI